MGSGQPPMFGHAAHRPVVGAPHGLLLIFAGVDQRGQLVEREDDVGAELMLDAHRHLGGESVRGTVQVGGEVHAVVVHPGQSLLAGGDDVVGLNPLGVHREHFAEAGAQRQHLESTAVGERRSGPVHESAQTARLFDDLGARLQIQVIRVGQDSLRAKFFHRFRQDSLDGGLGADGDERRSVDVAVLGPDHARASEPPGHFRIDTEERLTHALYSTNPEKRAATGTGAVDFAV